MSTLLPAPRPWPAAPALRWGILAPGGIAARFVQALRSRTDHAVVAVGSRSRTRGSQFARMHDIPVAFDYAELVDFADVDAVYIAAPHSAHAALALMAIANGKHVLVEKPLATTAADARRILDAARAAGVFAMEAMWTRYLPQSDIIRRVLADGLLGDIASVTADFGFSVPFMPEHRLFDPSQAGGALLDAGVYPVSFISSVLGRPGELNAIGTVAASGVDDHALVTFNYGRAVATALTSLRSWLPVRASIGGTVARLDVDSEFIRPSGLRLTRVDLETGPVVAEWSDTEFAGEPYEGLACEVLAFASFVDRGFVESPIHPHDEVVAIVHALDRARSQILTAATAAPENGQ